MTADLPTTNADQPRASCAATTATGAPCRGRPLPGRDRCFAHDPDLEQRRAQGRERGGRHRATAHRLGAKMPTDLRGVVDALLEALGEVRAGRMSAARGQAIASLGRAVAAVYAEHEVEDRLAALERTLAGGRWLRVVR